MGPPPKRARSQSRPVPDPAGRGTQGARARIIDGMVRSVSENGYARTTVADAIARAGVSRATFYEQFRDKEDCFAAAYDALASTLVSATTRAYREAEGEWPDRVRAGLRGLLELLVEHPEAATAGILEVVAAGPRVHERFERALGQLTPLLADGEAHLPEGLELPPRVGRATVGGIAGLLAERIETAGPSELGALLPDLTFAALVPYMGPERAWSEAARDTAEGGAG